MLSTSASEKGRGYLLPERGQRASFLQAHGVRATASTSEGLAGLSLSPASREGFKDPLDLCLPSGTSSSQPWVSTRLLLSGSPLKAPSSPSSESWKGNYSVCGVSMECAPRPPVLPVMASILLSRRNSNTTSSMELFQLSFLPTYLQLPLSYPLTACPVLPVCVGFAQLGNSLGCALPLAPEHLAQVCVLFPRLRSSVVPAPRTAWHIAGAQ